MSVASANLLTPKILCFPLGLFAALARSELTIPEAMAKCLSIYLLFAIGFKGGWPLFRGCCACSFWTWALSQGAERERRADAGSAAVRAGDAGGGRGFWSGGVNGLGPVDRRRGADDGAGGAGQLHCGAGGHAGGPA